MATVIRVWRIMIIIAVCLSNQMLLYGRLTKRAFVEQPDSRLLAIIGDRVVLPCWTDLEQDPIIWKFTPVNASEAIEIFTGENIINRVKSKYEIDTSKKGQYDLVIPKVDAEHAGKYECYDDDGLGEKKSTELIALLNEDIDCDNSSNICQVKSYGNVKAICERINLHPTDKSTCNVSCEICLPSPRGLRRKRSLDCKKRTFIGKLESIQQDVSTKSVTDEQIPVHWTNSTGPVDVSEEKTVPTNNISKTLTICLLLSVGIVPAIIIVILVTVIVRYLYCKKGSSKDGEEETGVKDNPIYKPSAIKPLNSAAKNQLRHEQNIEDDSHIRLDSCRPLISDNMFV